MNRENGVYMYLGFPYKMQNNIFPVDLLAKMYQD